MNREFSRNVITLVKGAAFSQAVLLGATPLLSRLYSPDDFGVFALYNSAVLLASVIAAARYEVAIVLPGDIKDAANVALLALSIAVLVSGLSAVTVMLFRPLVEDYLASSALGMWIYIGPLSVFLAAAYQVLNYWQTRSKEFGSITNARITQSLSNVTTAVTLGFLHVAPLGLIVGQVIGQIIGGLVLLRQSRILSKLRLASRRGMVSNARRYKNFPLINSGHAFVDSLQYTGVVLVAGYFFSAGTVGLYAMALKLISAPLTLLGSSMAQVYYGQASTIFDSRGDLSGITRSVIRRMAFFSSIPLVIVLMFGKDLFALILGESWRESGLYAQYLAPFVFFKSLVSPVFQLPNILGRQGGFFAFSLVGNLMLFASFALMPAVGASMAETLTTVSVVMSLYFLVLLAWLLRIAKAASAGFDPDNA